MVVRAGDDAREEGLYVAGTALSTLGVGDRPGMTQSLNPAWLWSRGPAGLCGLDPCGERR